MDVAEHSRSSGSEESSQENRSDNEEKDVKNSRVVQAYSRFDDLGASLFWKPKRHRRNRTRKRSP